MGYEYEADAEAAVVILHMPPNKAKPPSASTTSYRLYRLILVALRAALGYTAAADTTGFQQPQQQPPKTTTMKRFVSRM